VSDHDHCINGLVFGDHGELYIQVGGNTNGGVPGPLSGSKQMKENVLSAATLVAHLANPEFDGALTYDADDDGNLDGGNGVEVFAPGQRNPLGILLHSNGYLYGTDNGPNLSYGQMSTGCNGKQVNDIQESDELNLLVQGGYYGHSNRKRGEDDPRQCVWRSYKEPSDGKYTAPLLILPSSSNGIIEFQSDHFNGGLRGNLIVSKYKNALFRIILAPDGKSVVPESKPAIKLLGEQTFVIAQAPDGTIIDVRLSMDAVYYHTPSELPSMLLAVKSAFPRRGSAAGGSTLSVYGVNFDSGGGTPSVTVGGSNCPVTSATGTKIECTLQGGSGTVDVVVTNDSGASTFKGGYRYITGLPA
jgi:glucose/arabinose dehydrogenase